MIAIVSASEIKEHLNKDTPYVIIDARPLSHYLAGHIPGAVWVGWETWCEEAPTHAKRTLAQPGYWGVLKDSNAVSTREDLEHVGLSNDRPVLIYADGPISKGREGRVAWMLLYWGISSVFLLNGGWSSWLKSGGGSDVAIPTPRRGQFKICAQEYRRIQLPQLKQDYYRNTLPLLIDVRSLAEFEGSCHAYQPRLGRLPSAIHIPFTELFDDAGNFVTKSFYLQHLLPKIPEAHCRVAYCEVGVRSCLFALLHEVYTGQVIANFDGSIMEWALDRELPMKCDAL